MRIATISHHARTMAFNLLLALICAGSTFCSHDALALITVGPNGDTACNYHDIGAAVQAAGQAAGPELIAVSGNWTQQTTITDHDSDGLTIEGGFANCSAGVSSGRSTLDGQGMPLTAPLIVHSGNGPLTLLHLIVQNGNAGGIESVVAGPLTLSDVIVYSNHAAYGGGLFVSGNNIFRMQLSLIGSSINSNTATSNGGGLYVAETDISISSGSTIVGNIAQGGPGGISDGGGIYAFNSNIIVKDHSVPPNAFIGNNSAQRNGGGVYYSIGSGGNYEMLMSNDLANEPLLVAANTALNNGGAFYFSTTGGSQQILSFTSFSNMLFQQNEAYGGAVAFVQSSGNGSANATTGIRFAQTRAGDSVPPCAVGLECNAIDDNHAISGSIIDIDRAGTNGSAYLELLRGRMRDNRASLLINGNGQMTVDSSLIASNEVDVVAGTVSGDLHIGNSTFANNTVTGDHLFTAILPPASLEVRHSLFLQPDGNALPHAYTLGGGVPVTVRDIGTHNVVFDTGTNVQNLTDPFVNSASGNFHILLNSSAVDRWGSANDPDDPPPTVDLDGATRPYVKNSPTTPFDFGAYEAGAVVDVIFKSGFDP
jgi:hypothetical protein